MSFKETTVVLVVFLLFVLLVPDTLSPLRVNAGRPTGTASVTVTPIAPRVWVMQDFSTLEDVKKFINKLPAQDALDAKIVALSSDRTAWSFGMAAYTVFYYQQP